MKLLKNKWFITPIIGLSIGIFLSVLAYLGLFFGINLRIGDALFKNVHPSNDIIIVAIDEKSLDPKNGLGRWQNWRRTYYANVINTLNRWGAKTIGLDVRFSTPSSGISEEELITGLKDKTLEQKVQDVLDGTHPDDEILAQVLADSKNVVLADIHYLDKNPDEGSFPISLKPAGSLPLFTEKTLTGITQTFADQDDIIRKAPVAVQTGTEIKEGFNLKIANLWSGKNVKPQDIPHTNGYFLIHFARPPSSFKIVSFSDVYFEKVKPETVKDKIVLIGATAPTLQDRWFVPVSHEGTTMPGIEIHANAIQTILEEKFLEHQSRKSVIVAIILISVIGITVLAIIPGIAVPLLVTLTLGLLYWITVKLSFEKGIILNTVFPYIALVLNYVALMLYRYVTEHREKKFIKQAFDQYLSPTVVNQLIKHPEKLNLGGEKRNVSIFFSDIAGFTHASEKLDPQNLIELLNEYMELFSNTILEENGTLDKYEGDAIMAFFGAPINQQDHAVKVCKSALLCEKKFLDLQKKWQPYVTLDFRIGINSGEVIAGNVGSKKHFNYTVIGDNVNIASRLEAVNKLYKTRIMVSQATYALAKENFVFRKTDLVQLPGKDQALWIYQLLGTKDQLTEIAEKLLMKNHNGIEAYQKAQFDQAKKHFQEILEVSPEDHIAQLYTQRCQELIKNPPENWNGVCIIASK